VGKEILESFAQRAAAPGADPIELWARFPFQETAATVQNTWAAASSTLYANWMGLARAAMPAHGTAQA
jgi:hypothetical protein